MNNTLYFGDNLPTIRKFIKDETIDLIYLDPPFNSKANYNVIFKTKNKEDSPSQIQAFEDTWHWETGETEKEFTELKKNGGTIAEVMKGLKLVIGQNDLLAYLTMMAIRLKEMHLVLKDTGALYLHCDPTASHYLKLILDAIFGARNFRNEVIWERAQGGKIKHQSGLQVTFPKNTDTILFYAKEKHRIKPILISSEEHQRSFNKLEKDGRRYKLGRTDISASMGRRPNQEYTYKGYTPPYGWRFVKSTLERLDKEGKLYWNSKGKPYKKIYLDESEGVEVGSLWSDINALSPKDKERMGYPTQKPVALLERIITSSSDEGNIVLDPFCGCGTAIVAAQRLNRNWIGIDITSIAAVLMEKRIKNEFGINVTVKGLPVQFNDALHLFMLSPLDFERWAVTRVHKDINPNDKQVGDKGIDGRGNLGEKGEYTTIVSVKGGKQLNHAMVRELLGTVTRENATFGVLVTLHNPTSGMLKEAVVQGFVDIGVHQYPKIQIYTIDDYFNDKKAQLP